MSDKTKVNSFFSCSFFSTLGVRIKQNLNTSKKKCLFQISIDELTDFTDEDEINIQTDNNSDTQQEEDIVYDEEKYIETQTTCNKDFSSITQEKQLNNIDIDLTSLSDDDDLQLDSDFSQNVEKYFHSIVDDSQNLQNGAQSIQQSSSQSVIILENFQSKNIGVKISDICRYLSAKIFMSNIDIFFDFPIFSIFRNRYWIFKIL